MTPPEKGGGSTGPAASPGFAGPPPSELVGVRMSDGYTVTVSRYAASANARGIIIFAHGIQSHAGWYGATSHDLAAAGYDVWFADRRGSGRNPEQRGHARAAARLLADVRDVANLALRTVGECPVVQAGLCWGGKTAAAAAADKNTPADGLLLLYPSLFQRIKGSLADRVKLHLGRFLGAQKRLVSIPLTADLFTTDADWQAFIESDPMALGEVSVGTLFSGRELDRLRDPSSISCPTLTILAGNDRIVDNARIKRWAQQIDGATDTIVYDDTEHVLEFEPVRATMSRDIVQWLECHVQHRRQ